MIFYLFWCFTAGMVSSDIDTDTELDIYNMGGNKKQEEEEDDFDFYG